MNKELNGINKFLEGKTFGYDHRVSFSEKPVKGYYQFHIDKVAQLRSIGEMKDHLFVSVKLVNGEGMVNYYLCAFGNKEKIIYLIVNNLSGKFSLTISWYRFFLLIFLIINKNILTIIMSV